MLVWLSKQKTRKGEYDMRKVLSAVIALCLALSLFTDAFAPVSEVMADTCTEGNQEYTISGCNARIANHTE